MRRSPTCVRRLRVLTVGLLTFVSRRSSAGRTTARSRRVPRRPDDRPYRGLWVAAVIVVSSRRCRRLVVRRHRQRVDGGPNLVALIALNGVIVAETRAYLWSTSWTTRPTSELPMRVVRHAARTTPEQPCGSVVTGKLSTFDSVTHGAGQMKIESKFWRVCATASSARVGAFATTDGGQPPFSVIFATVSSNFALASISQASPSADSSTGGFEPTRARASLRLHLMTSLTSCATRRYPRLTAKAPLVSRRAAMERSSGRRARGGRRQPAIRAKRDDGRLRAAGTQAVVTLRIELRSGVEAGHLFIPNGGGVGARASTFTSNSRSQNSGELEGPPERGSGRHQMFGWVDRMSCRKDVPMHWSRWFRHLGTRRWPHRRYRGCRGGSRSHSPCRSGPC